MAFDRILVVGATGMLGAPVVGALQRHGYDVRVLARQADAARARFAGCEVVEGDVRDHSTVEAALNGCMAAHVSLRGRSLAEAQEVEVTGLANVAQAAAATGARVSYLSGAGLGQRVARIPFAAVKLDAERRLRESGAAYTIFRPTHFMESLPMFVRGRRAEILGAQPHRYHYLAAADFADMVARSFRRSEARNRSFDVFGPAPFTMREALEVYRAIACPEIRIGQSPLPVLRVVAALTRNAELSHAAKLFAAFQTIGEEGDRLPADELFGPAPMTLAQWCGARAATTP